MVLLSSTIKITQIAVQVKFGIKMGWQEVHHFGLFVMFKVVKIRLQKNGPLLLLSIRLLLRK